MLRIVNINELGLRNESVTYEVVLGCYILSNCVDSAEANKSREL